MHGNTHLRTVECRMNMCPPLCEPTPDTSLTFKRVSNANDTNGNAVSRGLSETGTVAPGELYYRVLKEPLHLMREAISKCNITKISVWGFEGLVETEPQKELDRLCAQNKHRLEHYRPIQRLLLRSLCDRPTWHRASQFPAALTFSGDLFEMVCARLNKTVSAPSITPDDLPTFAWEQIGSSAHSVAADKVVATNPVVTEA
jgi:hypothetical protein